MSILTTHTRQVPCIKSTSQYLCGIPFQSIIFVSDVLHITPTMTRTRTATVTGTVNTGIANTMTLTFSNYQISTPVLTTTNGTNTSAAMVVGSGSSLIYTGSGTINAVLSMALRLNAV